MKFDTEGHALKLIYNFIHEELEHFSRLAIAAQKSSHPPDEIKSFYRQMASGSHLLSPADLSTLVNTYAVYEPHLDTDEQVMVLGGILSACSISLLPNSASASLGFFVSRTVRVLTDGRWDLIDDSRDFLGGICRSMRAVVTAHLPLIPYDALREYFVSSRRFTQHALADGIGAFRLHPGSEILEADELVDSSYPSLPNQALMSIIFHFFPVGGPLIAESDFVSDELANLGPTQSLGKLIELGVLLRKLSDENLYLPVKYPDILVISLLIERFALAAGSLPSEQGREALTGGITALVDLALRNIPDDLITKDVNMFLRDVFGFEFYNPEVSRLLEKEILRSTASRPYVGGQSTEAVQDFYWAVTRNALRVHEKHRDAGYDNESLICGLIPHCESRLVRADALERFSKEQKTLILRNIKNPELKKTLLKAHRECRGAVLERDLGM
jgi:hypothetical protein